MWNWLVRRTLIVTAGTDLIQQWGDPALTIRAGDIVWIPPGVKHLRGATPTAALAHFTIHEVIGGKAVDWWDHVSDERYSAANVRAKDCR